MKCICYCVKSTVNTIQLPLTGSNISSSSNLRFNMIFYSPVKQIFVVIYFIFGTVDTTYNNPGCSFHYAIFEQILLFCFGQVRYPEPMAHVFWLILAV